MKFKTKTKNDVCLYNFEGNLIGEDDGSAILSSVNTNLEKGFLLFAIDLSKVKYMNSSGIGVLISILTKVRNRSGELTLIKPSEHIQKLLLITKLNKIFKIVQTESNALSVLQSGKVKREKK